MRKGEAHMPKTQTEIRDQIEQALTDFPGMITREQLAKFLGLCPRTIANMSGRGKGPQNPLRIGKRTYFDKQSVCDWLVARADLQRPKQ